MAVIRAPNLSQADADGCLWICINPDCPELCAGELETEDLVEGGVPKALAARLVRLIDYYEDTIEELHAQGAGDGEEGADAGGGGPTAPPRAGSRERAQADVASLQRQVRELRRRAPPWPPPRPTSSASSWSSPTTATTSPRPRTPSVPSPLRRPSAAPPATPPPTPRSASPASTRNCRGALATAEL